MNRLKRILVIQPLTCMGRSSLTVSVPMLASGALEAVPLPTALLSSHTGTRLAPPVKTDLGSRMLPTVKQFKENGVTFQGILVGRLYTREHISAACQAIEAFKKARTVTVVDPSFADNGKLYSGVEAESPGLTAELVSRADYVLPNVTEAAMLADLDYPGEAPSDEFLSKAVLRLRAMGAKSVVITGVTEKESNRKFFYVYEEKRGREVKIYCDKLPGAYQGAGDFFAAAFTAQVLNGMRTLGAVTRASRLMSRCIDYTLAGKTDGHEGIIFEPFLDQIRPKRFEREG